MSWSASAALRWSIITDISGLARASNGCVRSASSRTTRCHPPTHLNRRSSESPEKEQRERRRAGEQELLPAPLRVNDSDLQPPDLIRSGIAQLNEVPKVGLEPTRPCGHWILNPARLPIPPLRPGAWLAPECLPAAGGSLRKEELLTKAANRQCLRQAETLQVWRFRWTASFSRTVPKNCISPQFREI